MPEFRPMTLEDTAAAAEMSARAFEDLDARGGTHFVSPPAAPFEQAGRHRWERIVSTDPAGCWVATENGNVIGSSMAIRRGDLWALSHLAVEPGLQSSGVGGELLRRAHATAADATTRMIMASSDPRALRVYERLGLGIHAVTIAHGPPAGVEPDPAVRPGSADDADTIDAAGMHVRGAPYGGDIEVLVRSGFELSVHPGRGFALHEGGDVKLLAALDDEAAAGLLRTVIAGAREARVMWITGPQRWALRVCGDARLRFELGFGALMADGPGGAGAPWLPNGFFF